MLSKNKFFWISTLIFLVFTTLALWKAFPPLVSQYQQNRTQARDLDLKITEHKQYLELVKKLNNEEETVNNLYATAQQALPIKPDIEVLLLQLDGLLSNAKINAAVTAPIGSTTAPAAPKGGAEGDAAATKTAPKLTFTLSGEMDFPQLQALIGQLRTLVRWNKLTNIVISQSGEKSTATLSAEVFTKALGNKEFSGQDPKFLEKAEALFTQYQSYATLPDVTKEGQFGRTNPLAPE